MHGKAGEVTSHVFYIQLTGGMCFYAQNQAIAAAKSRADDLAMRSDIPSHFNKPY